MYRKIFAIVKKDFLNESSYKIAFVSSFLGMLLNLVIFYFIDKLFGQKIAIHLDQYGTHFFPYVMLNMGFFHFIGLGAGSFAARIRQEQMQGTLEALFLTPTRTTTILLGFAAWNLCYAIINLLLYIGVGIVLFQIDISSINFLSVSVILFLTIFAFGSLGVIAASFILIYKKGNPVEWMINSLEAILGGVYFPIAVLPSFLQIIAHCLPITYTVHAIQLAVYQGYSLAALSQEIMILCAFSLILTPLSGWIFAQALKKVRRDGTLYQY